MDKMEFMEGIHILQNNYNNKYTTQQLKLFYENIKDMSKDKYIGNIKKIIKTNEFMPNIAQIRGEFKQQNSYQQRDYSDLDWNKFYSNMGGTDE